MPILPSLSALAVAGLLLIPAVRSQAGSPSNVLLVRNRTEPSVAVNPRDPRMIVLTTNTDYSASTGGIYPTAYFTSHNSGRSFLQGAAPEVSPYVVGADPTAAIDRNGTVFYSYLSETASYCSTGHSAVMLSHSTDGGRSFRGLRIVDTNGADDKPNMAVESHRGRPSHVFVTWTRFHDSTRSTDVWYARSMDGGTSFRRTLLYSSRGDNLGTVPVNGRHGRIYVFWVSFIDKSENLTGSTRILFRASRNDGRHFGPVRQAGSSFQRVPLEASPGALRNLTMPAVAASSSGALYLAWPQTHRQYGDRHVDADIMLARSVDEGMHWSVPHRVNSSSRLDRFMPALTVLSDGSVAVAFYDRRNGEGRLDLYAARTVYHRGWHIGRNVRINARAAPVNDITFIPPSSTCFIPGRFFGDYIGLAAEPRGGMCLAWTDTQLGVAGETDIWFTQTALPLPPTQATTHE